MCASDRDASLANTSLISGGVKAQRYVDNSYVVNLMTKYGLDDNVLRKENSSS